MSYQNQGNNTLYLPFGPALITLRYLSKRNENMFTKRPVEECSWELYS